MKRAILFCALLALLMGTNAQETTNYKEKHPYKDWVKIAPKLDDAFLTTPEAIRIADNVLLYQHTTGGWPKNVYMPAELTADEYKKSLPPRTTSMKAPLTTAPPVRKSAISPASTWPPA